MTTPGFDQLVSALVATGTERPNAERLARRKLGIAQPSETPQLRYKAIAWPVRLTLPWSALVSDNAKFAVGGGEHPRLVHSAPYRAAKHRIAALARAIIGDAVAEKVAPLQLTARVWVPDNRAHDCGNFRKLVTDALEQTVYANDKQLWREVWERAGVDIDAPRAEVVISPIG